MTYQKSDFRGLIDVSNEVFERLELYHALLLKWQKAINIVSSKTIDQAWHRHFIDSAQIAKLLPEQAKTYADLGCGGGFPGLVLAIMRPDIDTHLIESDERKCQFMRTVAREIGAKVNIHTTRIESINKGVDIDNGFIPDFVTARALSSLEKLFEYCLPWTLLNKDLELCFMKGIRADDEVVEAQNSFSFDYESTQSITDNEAKILSIKNLVCL